MFRYFALLLLFLTSCNNGKNEASRQKTEKSEVQNPLIGQWGSISKGRPTFDISKDSIYHFGNKKSLPYIMRGNDMIISENGMESIYYNITVFGDTLVFESPRGSGIAAIRFKDYYPH